MHRKSISIILKLILEQVGIRFEPGLNVHVLLPPHEVVINEVALLVQFFLL